jgi:Beta protein
MLSDRRPLQIPLLHEHPVGTLPVSTRHYVPALQNKPGELDALRNVSEQTWERLTPIVHFVGQKRTERLSAEAVREQVRKVASAVGSHTVYLDVMRLRPTLPVAITSGDVPLLQQIYAQARKRLMCFVPVACAGESNEEHLRLIADAAVQDGHGVAVRYKMRSIILPSGSSVGDYLGGVIQNVGIAVERADLLIDLEYLDGDDEVDGEDVARHVTETLAVGPWRSVVLLGSSMPRMMGGIKEGAVGTLPRREWEVWTQLREEGLARMPAFGDYAVQSPQPPNGGGPGMRANIRYDWERDADRARSRLCDAGGQRAVPRAMSMARRASRVLGKTIQLGRRCNRRLCRRADSRWRTEHVAGCRHFAPSSIRH